MPDETRSNVYKLFRATRVSPDTSIDPSQQIRVLRRRPRLARVRRGHQDQVVAPHLQLPGPDDRPRHHAEHHRLLCRDHPRLAAGRPHLPVRLQPRRLHGALRRRRAEILRRADGRRLPGHGADPAAAARSQVGAAHRHRGGQAGLPARQLGQARSLSRRARGPRARASAPSTAAATRRHPTPRPTSSACGTRSGRSARDRSFLPCSPALYVAGLQPPRAGLLYARVRLALSAALGGIWVRRARWASIWGSACATGAWRASRATAWRSTTPVCITRCATPGTRWPSTRTAGSSTACPGTRTIARIARLPRRAFRPASSRSGSPAAIPISAAAIPTPSPACPTSP